MQKITKNVLTRPPFFDIINLALSKRRNAWRGIEVVITRRS